MIVSFENLSAKNLECANKYFIGVSTKNLLNLGKRGIHIYNLEKERNLLLQNVQNDLINLDKNVLGVSNPLWLSSDIAENNLCLENFSLYILNTLVIIKNIIPNYKEVVFICDDAEQVFIYSSLLKKNGFIVEAHLEYFKLLKKLLGCLYQKINYLFVSSCKIIYLFLSRFKNKAPLETQKLSNIDVLCVNWVDEISFEDSNLYVKDRYFGNLLSSLKEMGLKVEVVGKALDFSCSFTSIVRSAFCTKKSFYLMQDFLKLTDLIKIFIRSFSFVKFSKVPFFISDLDFSPLWKWCCLKDALKPRISHAMSVYFASKNLFSNVNNSKLKLLYPYENQPWEKTLTLAFKKKFRCGQSYAYQHFPIAPNYLTAYHSNNYMKEKLAPRLLLSDLFFGEELRKNGFKDFDLLGNYRLDQSLTSHKKTRKSQNKNKIILCSCSIQLNDSLELVSKSIKIINAISLVFQKKIIFVVNFHPYMQESQKNTIRGISTMSKVEVIFSPLTADELLQNAMLIFYNSNSICFNAAARGIPAIFVPSDLQIDLDRIPEVSIRAESIENTAKIVDKLLSDEIFYKEQSDIYQSYFDAYFIAPQLSAINDIFNEVK
jgi:hypothetical protein